MILSLGSLSIAAALPALDGQLASHADELAAAVQALQVDAQALAGDLAAATAQVSNLLAEQLEVQATLDALASQIASMPSVALAGVETAIADIGSGQALASLKAALVSIPDSVRGGLENAAAAPQAKLAAITSALASAQQRVLDLGARAKALADRIASAEGLRAALLLERASLASASIDAFGYAGPSEAFGGELDRALRDYLPSGGVALAGALVLVAQGGSAWAVLGKIAKVSA